MSISVNTSPNLAENRESQIGEYSERLLYGKENVQRKLNSFGACLVRFRAFEHKDCVRVVMLLLLRKEVIQPQVPLRLPCYDFAPVIGFTLESSLPKVGSPASNATNSHGVTGGVYKGRERIHRDLLIRDY